MSSAPRPPFMAPDEPIRDLTVPLELQLLGTIAYQEAWDLQAKLAAQRAKDEIADQLLFLQHPAVYTAGKRTQPEDRPTNGLPVIDVDRGGRITWHGPGQLVCYPIIKLTEPVDVVDYVRRLEEAIIQVVRDSGLPAAGRIQGRSGVWLPEPQRKVAALGIRVTHGVTMHGLALNVNNTLDYYDHIVPCGISDAGVTTMAAELQRPVVPEDFISPLAGALDEVLSGRLVAAKEFFATASDPCRF